MICSVETCGKPSLKRGLCNAHYKRMRRHGDPEAGRAMWGEPLAWLKASLLIDTTDCLLFPFARSDNGYPVVRDDAGAKKFAHRWVCEKAHGPAPTPQHEAAHSCGRGDEACVNKRHLSWKTKLENEHDKIAHGTDQKTVALRLRSETAL